MRKDEQLYRDRAEELMRIYREVAPTCITERQAIERVINHRSSRFWITPHAVYCKLLGVFSGRLDSLPVTKDNELRMYTELMGRVMRLSQKPEHLGKSLRVLCEIAVMEEAPEFYMSPNTFRHLLASERRRLRAERRRRHASK